MTLRYRSRVYEIVDGLWRGPDGPTVHLLTWVTDDLARLANAGAASRASDFELARQVAERLGDGAEVVVAPYSRWDP